MSETGVETGNASHISEAPVDEHERNAKFHLRRINRQTAIRKILA